MSRRVEPPGPKTFPPPESMRPTIVGTDYVVSAGHPLAAEAAARIFAAGGNAIDAGVAGGLVLNVVLPDMCNFGGVAPILVRPAGADTVWSVAGLGTWGREATLEALRAALRPRAAPGAGQRRGPGGARTRGSQRSSAGGRCASRRSWSPRPNWRSMASRWMSAPPTPSARSAASGTRRATSSFRAAGRSSPGTSCASPRWRRCCGAWPQPSAAATAPRRSRTCGASSTRARSAETIVASNRAGGGWLTAEDLAGFVAEVAPAVSRRYAGWRVHITDAWSQGPALLQALAILEGFDLEAAGHNSADYLHLIVESLKVAFADRERYYGDPRFVDVPLEWLLSDAHAAELRGRIDMERALGEPAAVGGDAGAPARHDVPVRRRSRRQRVQRHPERHARRRSDRARAGDPRLLARRPEPARPGPSERPRSWQAAAAHAVAGDRGAR